MKPMNLIPGTLVTLAAALMLHDRWPWFSIALVVAQAGIYVAYALRKRAANN